MDNPSRYGATVSTFARLLTSNTRLDEISCPGLFEHLEPADGPELLADRKGDAVERPYVRATVRHEVCAPFPQLLGRLRVESERGDRGRVDTAVDDEMPKAFGEHPRLARTGGGDHPGRAAQVGDRRELVRGQLGRRWLVTGRA